MLFLLKACLQTDFSYKVITTKKNVLVGAAGGFLAGALAGDLLDIDIF